MDADAVTASELVYIDAAAPPRDWFALRWA
jgi:hypothetical protein